MTMHAHHKHTHDCYATDPIGPCEFCGAIVTVQDAEPMLLPVNSIAHATCYRADVDAWAAWMEHKLVNRLATLNRLNP